MPKSPPLHSPITNGKQHSFLRVKDRRRGTSSARGYNSKWRRYSIAYRRANPLCVLCLEKGIVTAAQCVDHIIPANDAPELFWDESNHRSLCASCHSHVTAKEDGGFGNKKKEIRE